MFRADFFAHAATQHSVEEVPTPAGVVHVHSMNAGEKDAFDIAHARARGAHFRGRLVVATARDAEGKPLFSAEDVEAISSLPAPAIEPIVEAAIRTNHLSDAEAEGLRKN